MISSVLSPDSIRELISSVYDIKPIKNCELLQSNIHDTYKISTIEQNYIIKIFKYKWNTLPDIQFEIEFLNFLMSSGVLVAYPVMSNYDNYILKFNAPEGNRYFYLSAYAQGQELDYCTINNAYIYGKSVATLHATSINFHPTNYEKRIDIHGMYNKAKTKIITFLTDFPEEKSYFSEFTALLTIRLDNIDFNQIQHGFLHGDLHGGNVKYHNQKGWFYDFDFCGYGPILYDLSVFHWTAMLRNNKDIWNGFVSGYRSIREISNNELRHSLLFVAVRDIWVMYLYISRVDVLGKLYIAQPYLKKRMQFLKLLADKL